jgi:hypothetical protein
MRHGPTFNEYVVHFPPFLREQLEFADIIQEALSTNGLHCTRECGFREILKINYASALCVRTQIVPFCKVRCLWQAVVESLALVFYAPSKSYVSKEAEGLTLSNLEWDVAKCGQGALSQLRPHLRPMASNSLKLRAVAFISPQVAPRLSDPTSF